MGADFEAMVRLVQDFLIKGARGQVGRRQEELRRAEDRLQVLQQDDSEARKLAQTMLEMISKVKAA